MIEMQLTVERLEDTSTIIDVVEDSINTLYNFHSPETSNLFHENNSGRDEIYLPSGTLVPLLNKKRNFRRETSIGRFRRVWYPGT